MCVCLSVCLCSPGGRGWLTQTCVSLHTLSSPHRWSHPYFCGGVRLHAMSAHRMTILSVLLAAALPFSDVQLERQSEKKLGRKPTGSVTEKYLQPYRLSHHLHDLPEATWSSAAFQTPTQEQTRMGRNLRLSCSCWTHMRSAKRQQETASMLYKAGGRP